ncbi:MAG: hypothetical protein KIT09_12880 [Bryobacteraceae bacterium]|nr:hypothetical protein [Bryobacteraceae bacterium]
MSIGRRLRAALAGLAALLVFSCISLIAASNGAWPPWTSIALNCMGLAACGGIILMFLSMQKTLRRITETMAAGAEQVASAATQVSSSSQSLAQGASEQAASLEETSASSEEITSMTRKNAENSQAAADYMTQVEARVAQANRALEQMIGSMKDINSASDKIARIIKVIDEIAFQTNILALNAAVEAARAGEAGMGFAVVADEVRNLAQRSAQAARDTAAMIEDSIAKSVGGSAKLNEVAEAIKSITESATKVKILVDEVNLGSQEQARGIEQIARAITQIEQVTQKTAASAEQGSAASQQLNAQAGAMNRAVEQVRSVIGAGEPVSASPRRSPERGRTAAHVQAPPPSKAANDPIRALRVVTASPSPEREPPGAEPAGAKSPASSFPLDDDFKEF